MTSGESGRRPGLAWCGIRSRVMNQVWRLTFVVLIDKLIHHLDIMVFFIYLWGVWCSIN